MNGQDDQSQQGTWGQTLPALRNMQQTQFRPWMQGFNQNLQTDLGNLRQFLGTQPWNQPGFNVSTFNNALQQQLLPFRSLLSNRPPAFPWLHGGVPPMTAAGVIQPRPGEPTQPRFLGPPVQSSGGNMGGGMGGGTEGGMQPFSWMGEMGGMGGAGGTEPQNRPLPVPLTLQQWQQMHQPITPPGGFG